MPTNFSKDLCRILNTFRGHKFSKDLCVDQRSKIKQIKDHADQLLKRSKIKKINFEKFKDQTDQRSTKFKGQRSKIKES